MHYTKNDKYAFNVDNGQYRSVTGCTAKLSGFCAFDKTAVFTRIRHIIAFYAHQGRLYLYINDMKYDLTDDDISVKRERSFLIFNKFILRKRENTLLSFLYEGSETVDMLCGDGDLFSYIEENTKNHGNKYSVFFSFVNRSLIHDADENVEKINLESDENPVNNRTKYMSNYYGYQGKVEFVDEGTALAEALKMNFAERILYIPIYGLVWLICFVWDNGKKFFKK